VTNCQTPLLNFSHSLTYSVELRLSVADDACRLRSPASRTSWTALPGAKLVVSKLLQPVTRLAARRVPRISSSSSRISIISGSRPGRANGRTVQAETERSVGPVRLDSRRIMKPNCANLLSSTNSANFAATASLLPASVVIT